MNKIWEFFENMNELVYVSDMDTHELIYMNKKARDIYGINSLEEMTGKKCYEVIQNCSTSCTICNHNELKQGYFKEWQYYNPFLDKHLMLKETMLEEDGRRYRIELALDVSPQEQQGNMVNSYQNLEAMINEGLRVALQKKTPSQTIEVLLEYLGNALGGERTYIFEKNEKGGDDNTYEWTANGVIPEKDNLQDLPPEICANWYQNFSVNRHIVIKDLEDIREKDPLQYDNLKRQNIHSLVVVPLYSGGKAIGFYGVDNPPKRSLDYASNMLQIMAHCIVSSLKRRNLMRKLQEMSYCDQLTKIGNRHAMIDFIKHIKCRENIGIVYCDVTGLKWLNDTEGHDAGDRLIIDACEILKQVFGEYGLFRIGGDELLVICTQIEEKVMWENIELLKENFRKADIQIAVGAIWEKEVLSDIERLIADAEKKMYTDKAAYYKSVGMDRRR